MTQDFNQMVSYRGPGTAIEPWSQAGGAIVPTQQPQPLLKLHRLLRGRYILATLLVLAGSAVGGAIGWMSQKPGYKSVGVMEVKPTVADWDNVERVMLMYTQVMQTEVARLKSERLIKFALQHKDWVRETRDLPTPPDPVQDFAERLKAEHLRGTALIQVTFTHGRPAAAQAAVKAVFDSYNDYFAKPESEFAQGRMRYEETKLRTAQEDLRQARVKLEELASEYGDDLQPILTPKWKDVEDYRKAWMLQQRLYDDWLARGDQVEPVPVDEIALVSPTVGRLIAARDSLELVLHSMESQSGQNNPKVLAKRAEVESWNKQIDTAVADWRKNYRGYAMSPDGRATVVPRNLDRMKDEVRKAKEFYEREREASLNLQKKQQQMQSLKERIKDAGDSIAESEKSLEKVRFRTEMVQKPEFIDVGNTAVTAMDGRAKFGLLGVIAGGAVPLAFMLLIGLLDHRYRYSDEAGTEMSGITLLGILPNLPDRLSDPEQAAIAAHCVHQIRTMLQINGAPEERRVFAVTSASPGDGKTSLTLALGLSYAACGTRTLLIDCDLVGAGLTTRMNVGTPEGILEAVANRSLLPFVRGTDIADVSILPVGAAGGHHASTLSPAALRRLLDEAKQNFDIILIDTGPILGSIEASLVCAAADNVVLTVARGQQRPLVERSLGHLKSIGARLSGVVFNRAQANDFERSISGVSLRSAVGANGGSAGNTRGTARHDDVGPVARSVTSHVREK